MTETALAEPEPKPFQPPGMWIWDNWFVTHDGTHHAFYLQVPKAVGKERRWKNNDPFKHVGHAISSDLKNWTDQGPALLPLSGTWNDRHIATGSIIKRGDEWWMLFTGRGSKGDGVGIAKSQDLMTWKTELAPVIPLIGTFETTSSTTYQAQWEGKTYQWIGISDPYIYPEAVDGWFYLYLCSRIVDVPIGESGCLTLMRSRDLVQWENAGIIAWPRCFERMETPQVWRRRGQGYLTFGGVLNKEWLAQSTEPLPPALLGKESHQNFIYTMASISKPVDSTSFTHLHVPGYILKVLPGKGDHDIALFTSDDERGSSLSLPHLVTYRPNGTLQISKKPSDHPPAK